MPSVYDGLTAHLYRPRYLNPQPLPPGDLMRATAPSFGVRMAPMMWTPVAPLLVPIGVQQMLGTAPIPTPGAPMPPAGGVGPYAYGGSWYAAALPAAGSPTHAQRWVWYIWAPARTQMTGRLRKSHRRHTHTGQYASSDSGNTDDTNYTPTSDSPPVDTSTPGGIVDSLLGGDGGDDGSSDDGSDQTTAPSQASSTSQSNVPAPGTLPSAPSGPATPPPSTAPVVAQATATAWWQNRMLWYIVGGAVVATAVILIWRAFGHHGVKTAAKAAKHAGFYL